MSRKPSVVAAAAVLLVVACDSGTPPEPEPAARTKPQKPMSAAKRAALQAKREGRVAGGRAAAGGGALKSTPSGVVTAKPVAKVPVSPDDPVKGKFTLADATKGLPAKGKLECEMYEDKAPITVANFVGLARGLRPWKNPDGKWVKKPAYDGTVFHRIIPGFMIQGGDAHGTGTGSPGYVIPDEVWAGAKHDQPGLICMANRGPNTNGAQFFIMDGAASHLDKSYTIFGKCAPTSVVKTIANSPRQGDRATDPVKIEKITVARKGG